MGILSPRTRTFIFVLLLIARSTLAQLTGRGDAACQDTNPSYCSTITSQLQGACMCEAFGEVYASMCQPFLSACPVTCNLCEQQSSRIADPAIVVHAVTSPPTSTATESSLTPTCHDTDPSYCSTYASQGACMCEALGEAYAYRCQPFLSACPLTCNLCEQQTSTISGAVDINRAVTSPTTSTLRETTRTSTCQDTDPTYCRTFASQGACGCEVLGEAYASMCQPFLSSCPFTCNLCGQQTSEDAADVHIGGYPPSTVTESSIASNVRLVNGFTSSEGNVEVLISGRWGPICDNGWDITDGHIVCQSLGFHHALGITSQNEFFTSYSPMQLTNVQCSGNESNILQCTSDDVGTHPCGSANQAGVRCSYCNDIHEKCNYWAKHGACESDPAEILLLCPRICNVCSTRGLSVVSPLPQDDCVTGHCFTNSYNETRCIPAVELCITLDWIGEMLCIPTPNLQRKSFVKCMNFTERRKTDMNGDAIVNTLVNKVAILKHGRYVEVDQSIQATLAKLRMMASFLDARDEPLYNKEQIRGRQRTVTVMFLWGDGISHIADGAFAGLRNLRSLIIGNNPLENITRKAFQGLEDLEYLHVGHNLLSSIEMGSFSDLTKLLILDFKFGELTDLEPGVFSGLRNLTQLTIFQNKIQRIRNGTFNELESLQFLFLQNNNISEIQVGGFSDLTSLQHLNLSHNIIQYLPHGVFSGMRSLQYLDLNYNRIAQIDPFTVNSMMSLRYLFLLETDLNTIEANTLTGLTSVEKLATSDNRLCCQLNDNPNFTCAKTSQTKPLETCGRLFPNWALRIAGWVVGLSALVGNGIVLFVRLQDKSLRTSKVQNIMIGSLAIADILMGVYMIIITSADIVYGDGYYLSAPQWRGSHICRFAGFVGFLSSEASVFTLTLITVDRFICIMFPFGRFRIREGASKILVALLWVFTMLLSVGLVIITSYRPDVYGLSDVCLGLPLHVETESTGRLNIQGEFFFEYQVNYEETDSSFRPPWLFSIVVFIGVNLVSFLFILVCYVMIFIKTSRSAARVRSNKSQTQETKLAGRMAMLVATDLACWMPVIIMGILSQTGVVTLHPSLYAWTVILIVPINSSINPFLYTFIGYLDGRKSKKNKKEARKIEAKPNIKQGKSPGKRSSERIEMANGKKNPSNCKIDV